MLNNIILTSYKQRRPPWTLPAVPQDDGLADLYRNVKTGKLIKNAKQLFTSREMSTSGAYPAT
jgi:hypothetical protein